MSAVTTQHGTSGAATKVALPSPYVELDRAAWSRLRENHPLNLTAADLARLSGLGDPIDLTEVEEVYLPISRLLNYFVAATGQLHRITSNFLGERPPAPPSSSGSPGRSPSASRRPHGCCASCSRAGRAPRRSSS